MDGKLVVNYAKATSERAVRRVRAVTGFGGTEGWKPEVALGAGPIASSSSTP